MVAAGTRLGPYELVGSIGAGGMGEVYRARDSRLGREVAVKILSPGLATDATGVHRFEQEARAAAALNHPNILAVFDTGTQDGSPYIVSELLRGESLRDTLRDGPLQLRKAIDYALQIARGLAAAHERGIFHRDLKPENIFVTHDGRIKILDFGLAKLTLPQMFGENSATAVESEPGTVLGTVGYMSPEQVRGKPTDARSDLFSFGAILYEMLSGKRSFKRDSTAETMTAILKEDPPDLTESNPNIPPALERVVRHCLEKNPEERFQSARDVAFALDMLSSFSGVPVMPEAVLPERVTLRKRFWPFILVFAVFAIAAVALILSRNLGSRVEQPRFRQVTFRRGFISSARFTPDGENIIYTATWEGGPSEVYSTRASTSQGSLAIGLPQADIAGISPAGEIAAVLNRRRLQGWVQIGTLARTQLTGEPPRAMLDDVADAAWSPDGRALAIARFVGQRFRLEFPVGKVLYDTAGWVSHIRVSPAGDRVAFLDHPIFGDDRGMVAVVDLAGNKEVISTGTFASIQGLSWSPSGKEVWFTGSESGLNTALYAATLKQRQRVVLRSPGRLILQDVTRDGRVLMSREAARQVLLLVGPGQERDLSLLDWSVAGALSSDGQQLLFSEQGDGGGPYYSVYLRKTDGSAPVRLGDGAAVALSPDGKWALAMMPTPPAQYFLLPTGAGEARQMTNDTIAHSHGVAAWLPKGKEVVFEGTEQGGKPLTYVQDVENGKPRVVGPGGLPQIVISPDGKSVVLKDEHDKFAIYPVHGGQPIPIANLGQRDVPIAWSSDGNSILVTSSSGLPVVVDRVDVRAGRRTRFKEFMPSDSAGIARVAGALATPDGRYLVFNLSRILSDLYVVHGLK